MKGAAGTQIHYGDARLCVPLLVAGVQPRAGGGGGGAGYDTWRLPAAEAATSNWRNIRFCEGDRRA